MPTMTYASAVSNPKGKMPPSKPASAPSVKSAPKTKKKKGKAFVRVPKTSGKPSDDWSLSDLRGYVRRKKLNKPEIKISMSKSQLTAGLKKHGHWR